MDDCQYVTLKEINMFVSLILCAIVNKLFFVRLSIHSPKGKEKSIMAYKFKSSSSEKEVPLNENIRINSLT